MLGNSDSASPIPHPMLDFPTFKCPTWATQCFTWPKLGSLQLQAKGFWGLWMPFDSLRAKPLCSPAALFLLFLIVLLLQLSYHQERVAMKYGWNLDFAGMQCKSTQIIWFKSNWTQTLVSSLKRKSCQTISQKPKSSQPERSLLLFQKRDFFFINT